MLLLRRNSPDSRDGQKPEAKDENHDSRHGEILNEKLGKVLDGDGQRVRHTPAAEGREDFAKVA